MTNASSNQPDGWEGFPRMHTAAYTRGLSSFATQTVLIVFSRYRDIHGVSPTYEQMRDLEPELMEYETPESVDLALARLIETGHLIATDAGIITLTAADLGGAL